MSFTLPAMAIIPAFAAICPKGGGGSSRLGMVNAILCASARFIEESLTEFPALSAHDAWGSQVSRRLVVLVALIVVAGCSGHFMFAEREPWRTTRKSRCLNSGAVKETPQRVRISAINGGRVRRGLSDQDFALGESGPLGYDDEPVRPPNSIPSGAMPQRWPIQSSPLPPPQADASQAAPPQYSQPQYGQPQYQRPQYPHRNTTSRNMASHNTVSPIWPAAIRWTDGRRTDVAQPPGIPEP